MPGESGNKLTMPGMIPRVSVEPSSEEMSLAAGGLSRLIVIAQQKNRLNPEAYARTSLVQALLNHNDFVTIR